MKVNRLTTLSLFSNFKVKILRTVLGLVDVALITLFRISFGVLSLLIIFPTNCIRWTATAHVPDVLATVYIVYVPHPTAYSIDVLVSLFPCCSLALLHSGLAFAEAVSSVMQIGCVTSTL